MTPEFSPDRNREHYQHRLDKAIIKIQAADANLIHDLMKHPLRLRVIRFLAARLSPEDAVKRTFMPMEIINQMAAVQG